MEQLQSQQQVAPSQVDYAALLTALCQSEPAKRKEAEAVYNSIPAKEKFTVLGASLCRPEFSDELKISSAVLLRRLILSSWQEIQTSIPLQQIISSCNQLLLLLKNSASFSRPVREHVCNVVAALAKNFVDERSGVNQWSDFIQFFFESVASPNLSIREAAFSILAGAPTVLGLVGDTTAYIDQLLHCFMQNLSEKNQSNQFYVSLTNAVTALLIANGRNKDCLRKICVLAVPVVMILKSIDGYDDKETICQQLIEVAEEAPTSLRPALSPLMEVCVELMGVNDGVSEVRSAALELAVSLIESAPNMVKKRASGTIKPIILRTLAFMTEIEDDPEWHTSALSERNEEDPDSIGESALDRISSSLGGKVVLPILSEEVTMLLSKPDWQSRHAGLMAFSSAGEGCRDQLQGILSRVVPGILVYLNDPHPRVRYAACNTIGQMATDFSPIFEVDFHAQAIPALLALLVDFTYIRVQAHAAAALVNFIEGGGQDILINYLEAIIERLHAVLGKYLAEGIPKEESHRFVVEQLIVTLSAVADIAQETFIPYYGKFMPCLKYVIQTSSNQDDLRLMRGKAIECVSLIGVAVGKEQFMADASDIMQMLLATQTGDLKLTDDDPQLSYMMAAWGRICRILGQDFQTFLPYVMGPVLQAANQKVEITLLNDEQKEAIEDGNNSWECVAIQDQAVGIRTAGLEDKATACAMLVRYARELKGGFAHYVQQTAEVLVPLLKFPLHDDVVMSSAECMPYLLESIKATGEQSVMLLWNVIYPNLYSAIQGHNELEVADSMLESLASCIVNVGKAALDNEKLLQVTELLKEKFKAHFENLKEQYEESKDEDYEIESYDQENDDCLPGIAQLIDSLFVVYKGEYLPYFDQIVEPVSALSSNEPHIPWTNRQTALCIWDGLIEHGGQNCLNYQKYFIPLLQTGALDEHMEVRQAAFYGIGQLAQQTGSSLLQFFQTIIPSMIQMMNMPNSRSEENISATENAISALGRILRYCPELPNHTELLSCWIGTLPIWSDETEVPVTMEYLMHLIEQNDQRVLGANSSNLSRLISIVAEVFSRSSIDASSDTGKKMVLFIKQVHANPSINGCLSALSMEQQKTVQEIIAN